jgi:hypothetical protein
LGSAKFFFLFYGPQAKKVWETLPQGDVRGCKGDASFFGLIGKNIFCEIFADLNLSLVNFRRTQLAKLKIFITYNPSPSKEHLTRLTNTTWGAPVL